MTRTDLSYDEMMSLVRDCLCAECGKPLTIHTTGEQDDEGRGLLGVSCGANHDHEGYRGVETVSDIAGRGEGPIHLVNTVQKRGLLTQGISGLALIHRLMAKYPNLDKPSAAIFLNHCQELQLDPALNQIAPLIFRNRDTGLATVIPFPTEKGWAKMAREAEPEEWMQPPVLRPMPATDKPDWGYGDDDVVYMVRGQKRSYPEPSDWMVVAFTKGQIDSAKYKKEPSAEDPHHHCRQRAMRRWYQEHYPDAADKVRAKYEVLVTDSPLSDEIRGVIEAEYREAPPPRALPPGGQHTTQPRQQPQGPQGNQQRPPQRQQTPQRPASGQANVPKDPLQGEQPPPEQARVGW